MVIFTIQTDIENISYNSPSRLVERINDTNIWHYLSSRQVERIQMAPFTIKIGRENIWNHSSSRLV